MLYLLAYHISEISAGLAHNIVLGVEKKNFIACNQEGFNMFNNKVLAWGSGNSGCLGDKGNEDQYIPTKIDFFDDKNVKEASAGYTHSSVLTCMYLINKYFFYFLKKMKIFFFFPKK